MTEKKRVAIIGCGLIGQKRANALGRYGRLVACSDITKSRAKKIGKKTMRGWLFLSIARHCLY